MTIFNTHESEFTRGYQRVEINQADLYPPVYEKVPYIEETAGTSLSPRLRHAFMKTVGTGTYLSSLKREERHLHESII